MKRLMKRAIPDSLKRRLKGRRERYDILWEAVLDGLRFKRNAAPMDAFVSRSSPVKHIECQIVKDYHRVEKGLSLRSPKRPFGAEVHLRMSNLEEPYRQAGGEESIHQHVRLSIQALEDWNHSGIASEELAPFRESLNPTDVERQAWSDFLSNRRSVRTFSSDAVEADALSRAVSIARHSPSVCNRQPWNVRFYHTRREIDLLLELQNGTRGFGDEIPCLALITVDSAQFSGAIERNQPWIEGGLFSMMLSLALQTENLATCMLNMSVTNSVSSQVRRRAGLEESELVVMYMAVGHEGEAIRTPRSPRKHEEVIAQFQASLQPGHHEVY